jgi:2-amino-4-hydroxy-6-hydroxymethyldihydropteridine diphosphokinase
VDALMTAVRIRRSGAIADAAPLSPHRAWIALGSNLGDRFGYLRAGVAGLGNVVSMSQVFETDPVGGPDDQGAYLNMVVEIATTLDPFALLRRCQGIEAESMRQRIVHWGARTLDVDILMYDDLSIESEQLTVPHPRFAERRFVLAPLAEIAPELCPEGWADALDPAGVYARGPLS